MALKHTVVDTDNNFSINAVTRAIKNESINKTLLIQYDHNSEVFSFEIPKEIEKHPMEKCDIEIHFVNIDAKTQQQSCGVYTVTDAAVSDQDNSMLVFSWLLDQRATKYVGNLNFLVRFICKDENEVPIYIWNSAIFSGITVSSGLNNTIVEEEAYKDTLGEYRKALEQWKARVENFKLIEMTVEESDESEGENLWTATYDVGTEESYTSTLKVKNGKDGKDGIPGESGKSAYQMVTDKGLFSGTEDAFMDRLMCPEFYDGDTRLRKVKFELSGSVLNITTE